MAHIQGKSDEPLDFEAVLASLSRHCPGTELLDRDYGSSRTARLAEMCRALEKPADNAVVTRTVATSDKIGPIWQIRVPLAEGLDLVGTLSQAGLLLASKRPASSAAIAPVLAALTPFTKLRLKLTGMESDGESSPATVRAEKRPWWKVW